MSHRGHTPRAKRSATQVSHTSLRWHARSNLIRHAHHNARIRLVDGAGSQVEIAARLPVRESDLDTLERAPQLTTADENIFLDWAEVRAVRCHIAAGRAWRQRRLVEGGPSPDGVTDYGRGISAQRGTRPRHKQQPPTDRGRAHARERAVHQQAAAERPAVFIALASCVAHSATAAVPPGRVPMHATLSTEHRACAVGRARRRCL